MIDFTAGRRQIDIDHCVAIAAHLADQGLAMKLINAASHPNMQLRAAAFDFYLRIFCYQEGLFIGEHREDLFICGQAFT